MGNLGVSGSIGPQGPQFSGQFEHKGLGIRVCGGDRGLQQF